MGEYARDGKLVKSETERERKTERKGICLARLAVVILLNSVSCCPSLLQINHKGIYFIYLIKLRHCSSNGRGSNATGYKLSELIVFKAMLSKESKVNVDKIAIY